MTEIGLRPFARPTARTPLGLPMSRAIAAYEVVSPYGIASNAAQTARWNSVPSGASGSWNTRSSPAKYARSCSTAGANAAASSRIPSVAGLPHRDSTMKSPVIATPSPVRSNSPRGLEVVE
jgi:hypothetical protein